MIPTSISRSWTLPNPSGLDESSFLAALLTAVCRQSLELTPGFLCDAPNLSGAGTGKGLLVKAICVIASGVRPAAFTSGHDAEELDKRLTAALTEAHPAVFLDNFNNKNLTSDILASALTESPAMVRPMGHTKTVPLHTRTFIGITGNSVQIAEDMARRLLNTHLDARMENPEQRRSRPVSSITFLPSAPTCSPPRSPSGDGDAKPSLSPESPSALMRSGHNGAATRCSPSACATRSTALAEIKAADPKRRELIGIFEQWWTAHGDHTIKAKDLDRRSHQDHR